MPPVPLTSVARCFARFVTSLALDDVPAPVVSRTTLLALDTIGSCLASSTMDFGRAVIQTAERLGGAHESSLIGGKTKVAAPNAVLANGTLAHGLDFDDTREEAIVHTGSVAVPTALAVGEAVNASGKAVLEAMIAGVEVMCRVGLAVPGKFHARNFHPTALTGSFAAAAVAGKLYGLTEDQLVHAFGICGSQAGGIIEYLADGSWTKRFHPGWASHAGVVATFLAQSGFTGPESVFEGRQGFYQAFAGGCDENRLRELLESLGKVWEAEQLTFKPYPCGSIAHPYMDCALRLRERSGIRADQIVEVVCRTAEGPVPRLWEPLAAKVNYELDSTIRYPEQFAGHLMLKLDDGRVVEESQDHPRGGPDFPMPREELLAKFRGNAGLLLSSEKIERIIWEIGGLAARREIASLVSVLTK